jgi:hypothetical protein
MMVHFRKRLSLEMLGRVNEQMVLRRQHSDVVARIAPISEDRKETENKDEAVVVPNQGQLIVDASCAPADIRYPRT